MSTQESTTTEDYDSPWKDVLELFFPEFMAFFFPEVYAAIDWTRKFEFLDKEMQRLSTKAAIGRRTVDKLVEVWLKDGKPQMVLIHIEVQGQREADFPQRIFVYGYRLFDRYKAPVASFVILTDDDPSWRPNEYRAAIFGTELTLRFTAIKLLDYRARLDELERSESPFAVVVLSQLAARETHGDAEGRFWKKLEIARRLYIRGYQPQEVLALFEFLDSLLRLPDGMEEKFHAKLGEYKEEQEMKYISSIERIGIKKGKMEGSIEIILRLLTHRFGSLDERTVSLIHQLPYAGIEQLSDVLLEFQSPEEVQSWVLGHLPPSPVNGAAGGSHELERPQ